MAYAVGPIRAIERILPPDDWRCRLRVRIIEPMRRVDYLYDPEAPIPERIVPAVTVAVKNRRGQILLARRTDNNLWALPGGTINVGERVADAAVREVLEETGVEALITGLVGIYSDPGHVTVYADGGTHQEFSICFRAVPIHEDAHPDFEEMSDAQWFTFGESLLMTMHSTMRLRVLDSFQNLIQPRIR